jgi:hypothetical protein
MSQKFSSNDQLQQKLGLSYRNSQELHKIIDSLPARPEFQRDEIHVAGEIFEVYHRNIIECIKALYGDPEFVDHMVFAPERHHLKQGEDAFTIYHEMHTGKWWWQTQQAVEQRTPGATIIPVILSSDKTQVTMFRNKMAYPVYLTIGNIPKAIRRKPSRHAYILLAYLPTDKLEHITNKAARRRTLANLFHTCMGRITQPLKIAGQLGHNMTSGDGATRRGHPILACFAGDYPEQVLATCTKTGDCPICPVSHKELGENVCPGLRDLHCILQALEAFDEQEPAEWKRTCSEIQIKPIPMAFWMELPYSHIFRSISPDILHQLYQGIIKHLIAWIQSAYSTQEIDARCRRLPPNHHIRVFMKGISKLARVSGKEHDQICRFLLGLIVGIPLPGNRSPSCLVCAVRAIIDFLYLAQYPVHTSHTLDMMDKALDQFHQNKSIFIDLGIRTNFNIPKLHALLHYTQSIRLYGTTDNYNTEYTERLHIDFAKEAYRATNHKDEYPQMTHWLERREKVHQFQKFISWRVDVAPNQGAQHIQQDHKYPRLLEQRQLKMPKHPTAKAVTIDEIKDAYGAQYFREAFARFVVATLFPALTAHQAEQKARGILLPTRSFPVYHTMKFVDPLLGATLDAAHAKPGRKDRQQRNVPGQFDTVLVKIRQSDGNDLQGQLLYQCLFKRFLIYAQIIALDKSELYSQFQRESKMHCFPQAPSLTNIWHMFSGLPSSSETLILTIGCTQYPERYEMDKGLQVSFLFLRFRPVYICSLNSDDLHHGTGPAVMFWSYAQVSFSIPHQTVTFLP